MTDDLPFVQIESIFGQAIKYAGLRMKEQCEIEMESFDVALGYLRMERRALLEIEEAARSLVRPSEARQGLWPQFTEPFGKLDALRQPTSEEATS